MALVSVADDEPPVKIVDEIRAAPVEMRGRSSTCRPPERAATTRPRRPGGRQSFMARMKPVFFSSAGEIRIEHQARERHDDPRPRPERVVGYAEPHGRQKGMTLVTRRHHLLRHIAAPAGLGTRIPRRPPLYRHVRENRAERYRQDSLRRIAARPGPCRGKRKKRSREAPPSSPLSRRRRACRARARHGTIHPVMAMMNWKKSVTATPTARRPRNRRPPGASQAITAKRMYTSSTEKITPRISASATFTQPMMTQFMRHAEINRLESPQKGPGPARITDFDEFRRRS